MKRVIVTGATGLIGSHLIVELLLNNNDYHITALVRSERSKTKLTEVLGRYNLDDSSISYIKVDTQNYEEFREAIALFDVVFHCAAIVSFDSHKAEEIVANNVELTSYVVDACLSSQRRPLLVHISSIAALGTAMYPEMTTEQTPFTNISGASAYSKSKFLSENEVWRGVKQGLSAVVVCPSIVLGVGASESEGLQPVFRQASRGIPFYTAGIVGYVDVVDVARAMALLAQTPSSWGRRYILSSYNLSYRELISELNTAFGKAKPWIAVGKTTLRIAVALLSVVQRKPLLTKEMTGFLTHKSCYDGSLVCGTIPIDYTPISETARRIASQSTK